MKKVLIISPNFPPVNAADMHRVRLSLPYLKALGWEADVIAVDPAYTEAYSLDEGLVATVAGHAKVYWVKAWKAATTRRFGLGSLGMRSFRAIRKQGNRLLKNGEYDLVYFSTTAFHVMALGRYWKAKFGVPFILDIQDPWRNDFYLSKPAAQRPPKFRIAYAIDKFLEAKTVPQAAGIISVSAGYVTTFLQRYPSLKPARFCVIPFGGAATDFNHLPPASSLPIQFDKTKINLVYVGRGGHDLSFALRILFRAFQQGLSENKQRFSAIRFYFIGTSYAPAGQGAKTILPVAKEVGIEQYVTEITDRSSYFETLAYLQEADALIVPGSTDRAYTASKIFPYLLAQRPMLSVFSKESSVVQIIRGTSNSTCIAFDESNGPGWYAEEAYLALNILLTSPSVAFNDKAFAPYSAQAMTQKQTQFFDKILSANDQHIGKRPAGVRAVAQAL